MGAPTNYYVDPSIAADSGTGTVGDPYGDLQYALDSITRDSTNGDQINVKAGTDEVLSASIDYSTYGTPTDTAPLIFRGYTSAANDGGIGGISGGGSYAISAAQNMTFWIDLHLHNCGSADILALGFTTGVINCELDNTSADGIGGISANGRVIITNCHFHNIGTYGIYVGGPNVFIFNNYFANGTNDFSDALYLAQQAVVSRNIFSLDGSSNAITAAYPGCHITNNSILSSSGTGKGIQWTNTAMPEAGSILNNLVEGFSGGGVGIYHPGGTNANIIAGNGLRNNTTDTDLAAGETVETDDNESLGASPFDKSGSDTFANRFTYFAPVDTGNVRGGAYPSGCRLDKGAVQHADPAGGGGGGSCSIIGG